MLFETISEHEYTHVNAKLADVMKENAELYDFSSAFYVTIDHHYKIKSVNFQAALFLDTDRKQLTDKLFLNFITFNSRHVFEKTIQTLHETRFKQTCDIEMLLKGGHKKQVTVDAVLLKNNIIRLTLTDTTQTRQLSMHILELEKSLHLVNNLFQNARDAVAALDEELTVSVLNASFSALFTRIFSSKIEVGSNISLVLSDFPDIKNKITDACQTALLGKPVSVIMENDNEPYYCYEIDVHHFYNQYVKKNTFILRIRNLTDYKLEDKKQHQKQADIALACRTSTMSEMASAFAHEINQPLTAIIAYSQSCLYLIKNKSDPNNICDKLMLPLEQMAIQAEHAGNIIHNMKNIMDDGHFYVEKTDINALIKETLSILKYELQDFKFKISLNLMKNLPDIMTNKMHVMQIILNLARNSMEALQSVTDVKPELLIETRELNHQVVVHVIDNGPGIPVEFQSSILNTYFTTKPQGTGIGLGVCRSLIEALGGQLHVHQHTKNGAWFTFTLPIST